MEDHEIAKVSGESSFSRDDEQSRSRLGSDTWAKKQLDSTTQVLVDHEDTGPPVQVTTALDPTAALELPEDDSDETVARLHRLRQREQSR